MDRGRWLALLLLGSFVVGIMALTLWRVEPEPVVSTPLAGARPADDGTAEPGEAAAAAIAAVPGEQDAGTAPGADAGLAVAAARPERRDSEQGGLDYFIATLQSGKSFRVRARAALILGRTRAPKVLDALAAALRDAHPGVRVAAASSMGKQGSAARPVVEQALTRERDSKVRRALETALDKLGGGAPPKATSAPSVAVSPTPAPRGTRFYVGVGKATDPARRLSAQALGQLDASLRGGVARLSGVRVAPSGESTSSAKQVLSSDGRAGFYLDVSVASITHDPAVGTRAQINVMVGTYPGRDMRAMLKGAATLPGGADDEASRLAAAEGALQSAVRKLPGVFAAAQ